MIELRCLYCGHAMSDFEHHVEEYRDAHQPVATGGRDPVIDASAPVDLPVGSQDRQRTERASMWRRRTFG